MKELSKLYLPKQIIELIQVMKQKGGKTLIQLVNKIRLGEVDEFLKSVLKSIFVIDNGCSYPNDAFLIKAENNL